MTVLARQARLIIINRDPTYLDDQADVLIREDLAVALPALAAACGKRYPDNW